MCFSYNNTFNRTRSMCVKAWRGSGHVVINEAREEVHEEASVSRAPAKASAKTSVAP